ncbi:hypothetical protein V3C99_015057 [Haemonchus contortus]
MIVGASLGLLTSNRVCIGYLDHYSCNGCPNKEGGLVNRMDVGCVKPAVDEDRDRFVANQNQPTLPIVLKCPRREALQKMVAENDIVAKMVAENDIVAIELRNQSTAHSAGILTQILIHK